MQPVKIEKTFILVDIVGLHRICSQVANWLHPYPLQTESLTGLSFSAAIGPLEDDIVTPGTRDGLVTPGLEDRIATTGATGRLDESTGKGPLVPHTKIPFEELPTPGTSDPDGEEHKSTTTVRMVTSHSADKETSHPNKDNTADETQTTDKRDGLAVVTLVGIIVGVLLAIGFVGVIIIVVMRKISGRFSP
ncbi:podoplanin isoform X2 [Cricetulus griseus]|uniref:podoplanin isoform X2 n=1 Tax=Cricetulus griseus TaxID=10029 RepID=UPI000F73E7FE|nr:podoplanin isoform X2 [Cricetulus griseus]